VKSQQEGKEREDLFDVGRGTDEKGSATRKRHNNSLQAASNVTNSLKELRHTLATSLKSNEETLKSLVDSSGVLQDSNAEMKNMSSHIDISNRLITKFGRRQIIDKLSIFFGFVLFFSVVIYILKKRLIG
jgi:predicted DNA-binding ArsR family transcriptional regulator